MNTVELEAADALLDIGVSLPLKQIRIPFLKPITVRVTMRRPCLGSQINIARQYVKLGVTYDQMLSFTKDQEMHFMATQGKRVSKMIALTICRGPVSGFLLSDLTAFLLRWFVDDLYLQGANVRFVALLGTKSFTSIIRSVERANPLKPRLSQKQTGS